MKTIFSVLLFFPVLLFSQSDRKKDAEHLRKNCSRESFLKASEIYTELQSQQIENAFDTTLKNYYEFLESTKCTHFNPIIISAWENDKVINEKTFKAFFLDSKTNYDKFLKGYTLKKGFRFAESDNMDQGISDPLQGKMLKYIASVSKNDLRTVITTNIETLNGQELMHFISTVETKFGLKDFQKELIAKSFSAKYPFDLYFLLNHLIRLDINKSTLEKLLNTKKTVWDKGNWAEKFRSVINQEDLNIREENFYNVDSQNKKKYDFKTYLKIQQENNFIGKNPLLMINYNIFDYKENSLSEVLEKINIKDMQVVSKQQSINLYGARGSDGVLMVLSN